MTLELCKQLILEDKSAGLHSLLQNNYSRLRVMDYDYLISFTKRYMGHSDISLTILILGYALFRRARYNIMNKETQNGRTVYDLLQFDLGIQSTINILSKCPQDYIDKLIVDMVECLCQMSRYPEYRGMEYKITEYMLSVSKIKNTTYKQIQEQLKVFTNLNDLVASHI